MLFSNCFQSISLHTILQQIGEGKCLSYLLPCTLIAGVMSALSSFLCRRFCSWTVFENDISMTSFVNPIPPCYHIVLPLALFV